jgi:hypothetical protein
LSLGCAGRRSRGGSGPPRARARFRAPGCAHTATRAPPSLCPPHPPSPPACRQVHWLEENEGFPLIFFEGPNGQLLKRRTPGFVARYFNYWAAPPADGGQGVVYGLTEEWPDRETVELVRGPGPGV